MDRSFQVKSLPGYYVIAVAMYYSEIMDVQLPVLFVLFSEDDDLWNIKKIGRAHV